MKIAKIQKNRNNTDGRVEEKSRRRHIQEQGLTMQSPQNTENCLSPLNHPNHHPSQGVVKLCQSPNFHLPSPGKDQMGPRKRIVSKKYFAKNYLQRVKREKEQSMVGYIHEGGMCQQSPQEL